MTAVVAVAALGVIYSVACWLRPYTACLLCGGSAQRRALLSRLAGRVVIVACRWCAGTGLRLRVGRRAYNHLARKHREGQPKRTEKAAAK